MKAQWTRLSLGFMKRKRSGAEINPRVSLPGAARVCGIFEASSCKGELKSPQSRAMGEIKTFCDESGEDVRSAPQD